ncbi:hypothetical protein BKA00_007441 [Actinomadura coerulea]|uniref:PD-(D/E)XK endonuclease-like domain-containing protein n=1 Tax=Actinomadura coerulea TaxID=46159 RepID=A0A7X0G6U3_9ACTN|nr:hypothetical protein [Actinomadura coerulea]MBB6400527.1 hypothetical protein [Actinomadura coerulea]
MEPTSGHKAPGVTSIISMLPKPFLQYWSARKTAEAAADNLDVVNALAERDRDALVDFLKAAPTRYTKSRQNLGTAAHDMFERQIRGEDVRRVGPDLAPYKRHFAEFLDRVQPELISAEDVMWSDAHDYAGSSDVIMRITDPETGLPEIVIGDWKTSKDTYPDVSLQLTAYKNADRIISADGSSRPMPAIQAGAVLHVTDERWALKPVEVSDRVFGVFLALRQVFDWDRQMSKEVIGKAIESGGRLESGTERRAK